MCGIVGFTGREKAKKKIIDGLRRLEYRGYDSAGIALPIDGKIQVCKHVGGVDNLERFVEEEAFDSSTGIGHTRWATHGEPSDINAHPHLDGDENIAVVHNGIIENYMEIKEWLIKDYGIEFQSETDTEVIAQLIGMYYKGDLYRAVNKAVSKMRGAYAIGVIAAQEPDKIVAVRKSAPLIAGIGKDCNFIASDIPAFLKYVREVYFIEDNETLVVTKDEIKIYDGEGRRVKRKVHYVDWDADSAEKGGYEHFMMKEIHEQPDSVSETLRKKIGKKGDINLDGMPLSKEDIESFSKIYIVACGTAYHAGLIGKVLIEKMAKIPVEVEVASEFRYRDAFVDDNTLFIAISQSGETLDTLEALREAKSKGARILSVVNVVGSSVARESHHIFYTWAGPEISVASTKAYMTQLMCIYILAMYMGRMKETIDNEIYEDVMTKLREIPEKIKIILDNKKSIEALAEKFYKRDQVFFIGRGLDCEVSYEGSLKLKEISYINSFAIAAGELKHGTIALIEKGTLVIATATQDYLFEKMISNIVEIKSRGAEVIVISKESNRDIEKYADFVLYIPDTEDELTPLLSVVFLQLFAYYVAHKRGLNIDKPKNLAKAVTVE